MVISQTHREVSARQDTFSQAASVDSWHTQTWPQGTAQKHRVPGATDEVNATVRSVPRVLFDGQPLGVALLSDFSTMHLAGPFVRGPKLSRVSCSGPQNRPSTEEGPCKAPRRQGRYESYVFSNTSFGSRTQTRHGSAALDAQLSDRHSVARSKRTETRVSRNRRCCRGGKPPSRLLLGQGTA
jgi:hypothetical protein